MKRLFLSAALALIATSAFAQVKISELPTATTPLDGTELVPLVQGSTVQATVDDVSDAAIAELTSANVISKWTGTCSSGTYLRGDGTCAAVAASTAGTYAPTLTAVANATNPLVTGGCQYMQVGTTVTVSCFLGYDQTSSGATTRIAISLPVASALTAIGQVAGAGADAQAAASCASGVFADFANDRAEFRNTCAVTGGREASLTFTYRIL